LAKTKVILTVDTEPSIAGAFEDAKYLPLLHEPIAGVVGGQSEALGFILRVLREYELMATFFVETCHANFFRNSEMRVYVDQLCAASQDVQLHLHPSWLSFNDGKFHRSAKISDHCSDLAVDHLSEIIIKGCDLLASWTGESPTSMRTGNFSTNRGVFRAMKQAGLLYSSNICLAVQPPQEKELQLSGGVHLIDDVLEFPVTCFHDRGPVGRGQLRPMQVTALGASEMIDLLNKIDDMGGGVAVIVTHPFEFVKTKDFRYSSIRPNRLVQGRLKTLCGFLAGNADKYEVVSFGAIADDQPSTGPQTTPSGSSMNSIFRACQNYVNDRML